MTIKDILGILIWDLPDCQIETYRRNFALEGENPYWGNSFTVYSGDAGIESFISDVLRKKLKESAIHSMAKIIRDAFQEKVVNGSDSN